MSIENSVNYINMVKKKIDIKGRICPMTFVYTKLALEKLNKGDLLEVELNFLPALKNVPNNCKRQGLAELLEVREIDKKRDIYELVLKKI
ncbi:MAG: sulfurtransferase TusA family protein [Candidatus Hermodarchaeota archaeon]